MIMTATATPQSGAAVPLETPSTGFIHSPLKGVQVGATILCTAVFFFPKYGDMNTECNYSL